jgi:hypothetical protein
LRTHIRRCIRQSNGAWGPSLILFCDTSALAKRYILEDSIRGMQALAGAGSRIGVCRIAWAEMMSALARRTREFPRDADAIELVRKRLRTDWPKHVGQSCQDAGDAGLGLNRQPDAM